MPINYKDYPTEWRKVSLQIRTERAGLICECTGECGTDHAAEQDEEIAEIFAELGKPQPSNRCQAMNKCEHPITNSKVVLTVAHLCKCEPKCADVSHLKAMCQRCHLRLDGKLHARNAAKTRRAKRNNGELFPV